MASNGRSIKKSYHLQMESDSGTPNIEMPPLPPEQPEPVQAAEQPVPVQEQSYDQEYEQVDQDVVDNSLDSGEIADEQEEEQVPVAKDPSQSFREIRSAKEKAERERDALMSKMLELQSQQLNKANPAVEEPDELDLDVAPEDLLEGKHLQKYIKQMKEMKKELREYKSQSKEIALERKLRTQYPDFDTVLNADSVASLNQKHPSIAKALAAIPDDYDKATAAYEMIKNLNLSGDTMASKKSSLNSDKAKAVANSSKPRPLASVSPQQGDSPLSKANAFANGVPSEEYMAQLRKEMSQAIKSR